jgi:prepilin-type processing-associated H-X9-DG protein
MKSCSSQHSTGLTVIELTGILAVLGVVILLALPSLNNKLEQRRRAACANNLRQIGVALLAYAHDHTDHLPTSRSNVGKRTWDMALIDGRYAKPGVFHCPSDFHRRPAGSLPRTYAISGGSRAVDVDRFFWVHGARLTCQHLTNRAGIVIVTERPWGAGNWAVLGDPHGICDTNWSFSAHFPISGFGDPAGFNREMNYLFLDGHVEWLARPTPAMFPPNPTGKPVPCP